MKRLLLIAALVAPTWLYSCMPKSVTPDPATIVKETFDALPVPEVREIPLNIPEVAPTLPSYKHQVKPRAARRADPREGAHVPAALPARPLPKARPPAASAPVAQSEDTLPPQQGVICIFPLNMIPNCTPEPAGRLP